MRIAGGAGDRKSWKTDVSNDRADDLEIALHRPIDRAVQREFVAGTEPVDRFDVQ